MFKVGNDEYTEDELLDIIKKYEQSHGKYIKSYYSQLPRETREQIIQNLPYYHNIVSNPYENIDIYKNRYCNLPITKENVISFIKKQIFYDMFIFIFEHDIFTIYFINIDNKNISKITIYTITKGINKFNWSKAILENVSFNDLDFMDYKDTIIDIESSIKIFNHFQCYKYIDIIQSLKNQTDYYFKPRVPANNMAQLFENVKVNIYIYINDQHNRFFGDYFNRKFFDISPYPLVSARFDNNGLFIEWLNEGEDEHNWFLPDRDTTLDSINHCYLVNMEYLGY